MKNNFLQILPSQPEEEALDEENSNHFSSEFQEDSELEEENDYDNNHDHYEENSTLKDDDIEENSFNNNEIFLENVGI